MPAISSPSRQFRTAADRFFEESFRLFPQEASAHGRREFDSLLGSNTPATYREYAALLRSTLAAVEAIPPDSLTTDEWLDRRGLLAMVRTALLHHEREDWRRNPQWHCDTAVNAIFHLLMRHADRLPAALPAIESRLAEIPRYLAEGAACVRLPVPLWVELAVKSCTGAETFLADAGRELASVSPHPERTTQLARDAAAAFAKYARAISSRELGPAGGFSVGRDGFEMLVRERTGLSASAAEIAARGDALVQQLTAELNREAKRHGRTKAAEVLEAAAARWQPRAGTLLEEYQAVTTAVRDRFEHAGVVTFPKGERCKVQLVPPFLRHHFPTAAYSQPGAFDRDQTGTFWVNDLSLEQTNPAKKQAEVRQHFGLDFTCAHEAYPGHHLQFCIQNKHASKWRRLFQHAIFYEGWTLWCEKMSVEQNIIDLPEARLIQLHDALWRAYRIGIDCGLHTGTLDYKQACQRLQQGVGFTKARAQGDVNWYTSSPTVPMSYLLGRLELERLHAHLTSAEGWSLRQFNDWILSFGAIPWSWIWESRLRTATV